MAEFDLRQIETLEGALRLCIDASGITPEQVAEKMGIKYSYFSRMLRDTDSRNFPPNRIDELMTICGNVIPLEWQAVRKGFYLHESSMHEVLVSIRDAMLKRGGGLKFSISDRGTVREAV